jgi:1-acylglycerone phosphate reductase
LLQLDVTSIESTRKARNEVVAILAARDGLNVLVNNAGVIDELPALDHSLSATRQMFEINLFGMMAMVQEFTPLLMLSSDASIVNIGDVMGLAPAALITRVKRLCIVTVIPFVSVRLNLRRAIVSDSCLQNLSH